MRTHRIATAATVAALAIAGTACAAEGNYDELSPGQEAPAEDGVGGDLGGDVGGDVGGDLGGGGETDSTTEGGAGTTGGQ